MPAKFKFTKRALAALEAPAKGRVYCYDTGQANLALCITAKDVRTFYRAGRVDGRYERIRLGCFPDLSVEQARKAAAGMSGDIAHGINPKRKRDTSGTVEALFIHWLTHAKLRKKSWRADQSNYGFHFGPVAKRKFATLTTDDVAKWHTAIGRKRGTVIANRCRALLSSIYSVAHELGYTGPNPVLRVKRFPEKSRERFLKGDELRPFFEALKTEPPLWRDFWLLCLFTGARRGNVARMAWAELDLDRGIWYVEGVQMKNGLPLAIALVPQAVEILDSRSDGRNGSDFVFPGDSPAGYIRDPRKSWARVVRAAGIDGLNPHDLRRSLGSWQAIGGSSLPVIGQSLGHRDAKSTSVYAHLILDPVRTSVVGAVQAMLEHAEAKPAKKLRTRKGRHNGKR